MRTPELTPFDDELSRLVADGDTSTIGARLAQVGWISVFDRDPGMAVRLLFGSQGVRRPSWSALSLVMGLAMGEPVSALVRDGDGAALVLPAFGSSSAPAKPVGCMTVDVDGLSLGAFTGRLIAVAELSGEHVLGELTLPAGAIQPSQLDAGHGLSRIHGRGQFKPVHLDSGLDPVVAWRRAVAIGRLALASELTAIGDRVVHSSVDYAAARILDSQRAAQDQFADVEVELAVARCAVLHAANDVGTMASALAKLLAGRAAMRSTACAQLIDGGIGFTWDRALHSDARRVVALDSVLGSADELAHEVGMRLCAQRLDSRSATPDRVTAETL